MTTTHLLNKPSIIVHGTLTLLVLMFATWLTLAHAISPTTSKPQSARNLALKKIPRISPYAAFLQFKAGKALIVDAQHSRSHGRRIAGAIHINGLAVRMGKTPLPRLPSRGVELYFYCY